MYTYVLKRTHFMKKNVYECKKSVYNVQNVHTMYKKYKKCIQIYEMHTTLQKKAYNMQKVYKNLASGPGTNCFFAYHLSLIQKTTFSCVNS